MVVSREAGDRPSLLKVWLVAVRPFALPAAAMPVLYGNAMAAYAAGSPFRTGLLLLTLVGVSFIALGSHVLSDVSDFRRGLDVEAGPGSGALVRGWLTPRAALSGAAVLFGAGILTGGVLVYLVGNPLLIVLGAAGVAIGAFYTLKPLELKYRALGDVSIFSSYGVLGTLGAWTVQTGRLSWLPVMWGVPLSLLIVAILHANNWRDMDRDTELGMRTVASILGRKRSFIYYNLLVFGAYAVVAILTVLPRLIRTTLLPMPFTLLLTGASLPLAVSLSHRARQGLAPKRLEPELNEEREGDARFRSLDVQTAKLSLLFGLLSTAALILAKLLQELGLHP